MTLGGGNMKLPILENCPRVHLTKEELEELLWDIYTDTYSKHDDIEIIETENGFTAIIPDLDLSFLKGE
jgi:hypothetical protein